ncbi:MAG: hypothetical protein QF629_08805 [Alphaproteobacteria bacterium]|jgi:hypothetical protein|nr:hypothetical protein [Alphaproteobacteria bacterium]MDP7538916.1 hypothetical protein [Alphaproteobacteria bacterium]|tara:strand:- start:507 stop:734 length:228 start_codon:yes stop_codon:yes gene_type:complete
MSQSGYLAWSLALAAVLWWPVGRIVWVMAVRRLERKLDRELDVAEVTAQRRRAWLLALPLCLVFAGLFNLRLLEG